ncbi:MAG: NapC/NirT family cytochrome c [Magnetococcales bacterium]|nr:NapC/NirT family cytochrome c [Magnetococcales bacterium]
MVRQTGHTYSLFFIVSFSFVVSILFWEGVQTLIEASNSLAFCLSCHEMRDTVYREYKQTIHYSNRTGIRTTCADCHVPKSWGDKMLRKLGSAAQVWSKWRGVVDTPEKFEAKRMEMATAVWTNMKATDSIECRNCHRFEEMDVRLQTPSSREKHKQAEETRMTCIDCHKGIAHKLPREYKGNEEETE